MPKKATVIGAGFSGLASAYYLQKAGYAVEIHEKTDRPGGLLGTEFLAEGLVETAANGIMNSALFEELAGDIGLPWMAAAKESRKRYFWRGRPVTFPFRLAELPGIGWKVLTGWPKKPRENETVRAWGERCLGRAAVDGLLEPALQGVYAGDVDRMSASLIFGRMFRRGPKLEKPSVSGTAAPEGGMGQLVEKLRETLEARGVVFRWNSGKSVDAVPQADTPVVIAVSAVAAGNAVAALSPEAGRLLASTEMLPLVTATVFYPRESALYPGFGCLFPKLSGFRVLGILMNPFIFPNRSALASETWIFGGARDPGVVELPDAELLSLIRTERAKFYGITDPGAPINAFIRRHPVALPHYTVEHEKRLSDFEPLKAGLLKKGVAFAGNWTGTLGLGRILEDVAGLPERLALQGFRP